MQLSMLLLNLQIKLSDPGKDASVIMECIDVNGSQSISIDEWCEV